MKRIVTMLLAVVMLLSLFAACTKQADSTPTQAPTALEADGIKLWYAFNTENYMQDTYYPEMESRDYTLRMFGIRGDVESVQLIITPDHNVSEYEFSIKELTTEAGDKIAEKNIAVYSQWYVNVDASYNTAAGYGHYPDALVPMETLKREKYNTIAANMNQGIWINVTIPEKTNAGFYTGTGTLEMDGKTYDVPVELTVYNAVMPEEVHPRSCFLIWYDYMEKAEGSATGSIAQAYFDILVDHRVMPMYPEPAIYSNYETFVSWVANTVAENPKISTYSLPYGVETNEEGKRIVSREKCMELLSMLAQKNIAMRQAGNETVNLFKKGIYYLGSIIDEPTGEALTRVKVCDQIISECKFAVADQYLKDYPDLYNSLAGLPHVVTTGYNEDLLGTDTKGGVQAWCPQFQHWHTQEQREKFYARQNTTDRLMGEEAWWYGCNNPTVPFPTYHLDDDLIASRVLSWMQYDYGSEGNLYWCVNCSKEDMWEEAYAIGGAVGEGNLTYPAKKFRLKEPLPTMRLESIREGLEDYEYLWMIEQAVLQYNAENGTNHDAKALMASLYESLYDGMIPHRDNAEIFHQRRITVLDVLQTITADPASGIAALEARM